MAQMTWFGPRKGLLGVRTMDEVIWWKYSPKTLQKGTWIGSFKPKRQNLYIAISPELLIRRISNLRTEFRPRKALRMWSAITQSKYMADGRHLENRHDVILQQWMFRSGQNSVAWFRIACRLRELVEIETGSRIPIWRTFVFRKGK